MTRSSAFSAELRKLKIKKLFVALKKNLTIRGYTDIIIGF